MALYYVLWCTVKLYSLTACSQNQWLSIWSALVPTHPTSDETPIYNVKWKESTGMIIMVYHYFIVEYFCGNN